MNCFLRIIPLIYCLSFLVPSAVADDPVDFNRQIRPLLNKHCIACHGPDEGDRQADLRLDTYEDATDYAIEPGDAEASDFFDRITSDDEDLRMPPAVHADALKPDEIALIRKWIDQGAKYQQHWSFSPIGKPEIPKIELPNDTTVRIQNEIDNFVLDRTFAAGLSQSSLAKPSSLVRRMSLDLTGLPPVSHGEQVQQSIAKYLSEPNQKNIGVLVDHLLETPAFAEHWASVWLDLARYADTCGYSGDEKRDIWPWRDWLIRALQENKSYKDLSTEMLAGDLLPNATKDQQLATAFHRNTLSNNEGGTNDEEFRTIAVKDRLSTTLNAWMGLTVRCAECHSHKYDPISQVEYYQLLDFFNQTVDADNRDDRPKLEIKVLDPDAAAKINSQIAKLKESAQGENAVWKTLLPKEMKSRSGTKFKVLDDDSILAFGPLPGVEEYAFTFEIPASTSIKAIRLEALPHVQHNGNVGRAPEGSFILSQIRLAKVEPSSESEVDPKSSEENQTANETIYQFSKAANSFNQVNRHARTAILPEVKPGANSGWAINHPADGYRTGQEAIFELKEPLTANVPTTFKIYLLFDPPWKRLNMGCVRLSFCEADDAVAKYEKKELDPINRKIQKLITKRDAPVRVPVIQERAAKSRRETYVNLRGNFQSKGEKVSAKFPEAFEIEGSEFPMDRLGLANWMFDSRNPLTARVAVNRYWARIMGIGIVETEEDFGTQGSMPSHPELLDHLAYKFRKDWDVRKLLKKIVMSATYQQSQQVSQEMLDIDPRNRLLARGPRVRLTAEVVRDQALAVAGLLSDKMYGKPVYPPNPIKKVVNAFTGGTTWQESQGEDRYRRAIYTFLKRSAPHPLFETFDVSNRDVCSMRRLRTNTPLQSFMTLNDVTFVEAARALGEKMLAASANKEFENEEARLAFQLETGIKTALYEASNDTQIKVLSRVYKKSFERFAADLKSAAAMTGKNEKEFESEKISETDKTALIEHAAMTVVSNVILNLDSFLNN